MGGKSTAAKALAVELVAVETLMERHGLAAWQRRGLMVHARWGAGQSVTEGEFKVALAAWRRSR